MRHELLLRLQQNTQRNRGKQQVRHLWRHTSRPCFIAVQAGKRSNQRLVPHYNRWTTLDHGDVSANLPELSPDIVCRGAGTDHDATASLVIAVAARAARMALLSLESSHSWDVRDFWRAKEPGCEYKLLRIELDRATVAYHLQYPFVARLIEVSTQAFGICPEINIYQYPVGVEPVGELIF